MSSITSTMSRRVSSFGGIRIPLPATVLTLNPGASPEQWPRVQHEPSSTAPPRSTPETLVDAPLPNTDLIGPSAATPSLDLSTPRRRFSETDGYIQPSAQAQLSLSVPASPLLASAVSVEYFQTRSPSPSPSTGSLEPFPLFDPDYPHSPDWESLEFFSPPRAASPLSGIDDGLNGTFPSLSANPSATPPPPTTPQPEVGSETPSDFCQTADQYLMSGVYSPTTPYFSVVHNTSGVLSPFSRPCTPTSLPPRVRLPPSSPIRPANPDPAPQPSVLSWTHSFRAAALTRFTRRDAGGDDSSPTLGPPMYGTQQPNPARLASPENTGDAERYGVGDGKGEVQLEVNCQESGDVVGTELASSYSFCENGDLDEEGFFKTPDVEMDPAEMDKMRELFEREERAISEDFWMDEPGETGVQQPMPLLAHDPRYIPLVSREALQSMSTIGSQWVTDGTEYFYWNGHSGPDLVTYRYQDVINSNAWYAAHQDAAPYNPIPQPLPEPESIPEIPAEDAPSPASNPSNSTVRPIQRSTAEVAILRPEPAQPVQPTEPTPPTLPTDPLATSSQPTLSSVEQQELTTLRFIAPAISDDAARLLPQPEPQDQPRAIHPRAEEHERTARHAARHSARRAAATALPAPTSQPRDPAPRTRIPNLRFPPDEFPYHPANLDSAGKPRNFRAGPSNNGGQNNNGNGRARPSNRPRHRRRPARGPSPRDDRRIPRHIAHNMRSYDRWEQTVLYHHSVSGGAQVRERRGGIECYAGVPLGFLYSVANGTAATSSAASSAAASSMAASSATASSTAVSPTAVSPAAVSPATASSAAASSAAAVGGVGRAGSSRQPVTLHDHTARIFAPPPYTTHPKGANSWRPNPWLDATGRAVTAVPPKKTEVELEEMKRAWKEWVVRERVRGYLKMKREEGARTPEQSDDDRKTEKRVEGEEGNGRRLPQPDVGEYTLPPPDRMRFRFRVTDGSRRVAALAAAAKAARIAAAAKAARIAAAAASTATAASAATVAATATTAATITTAANIVTAATATTASPSAPANGAGAQAKAKPKPPGANAETRFQFADLTAYLERRAYAVQRRQPGRWFNGVGLFGRWIAEVRGEVLRVRRERAEELARWKVGAGKRREERKKRNEERIRRREEKEERKVLRQMWQPVWQQIRRHRKEWKKNCKELRKRRKDLERRMERVLGDEEPEEEKGGL